jgi:hypothetical protein
MRFDQPIEAPPRPAAQDDLQALIEEARRRARKRRRRNGAAAAIAVVIAAGGYLLAAALGGTRTPSTAGVASSSPARLRVGVGPFWYVRTIGTMRAPRCAKPLPGVMNPCASTVWFDVVMSTETWVGVDGTMRDRSVEVSQRFASPADRARWLESHKPVPVPISIAQGDALDAGSGHFPPPTFGAIGAEVPPVEGPPAGAGPVDVGDGLFTYRELLALPTDGAAALARIEQAETALRQRYGQMLLRWHSPGAAVVARSDLAPLPQAGRAIQELTLIAHLDAAPVPPRVRLGLFHAATLLTGMTVTRRAGARVTVSASSPHWEPASYTFDRGTGELLTGLPVDGGYPDVPGKDSVIVAQGPVGSITALPRGLKPIRAVGAPPLWPSPPAPRIETVFPAVGGPRSVFTVLLGATAGERAHPPPTASLGITGSAGYGIYHAGKQAFNRRGIFLPGNQGVDPCLPQTSVRVWPAITIHRAGQLVYVYRVVPQRFHLRAWCPGRYSLSIQTFPNPLPPRYTTPPYTGQSGTSTYFEVR